MIKLTAVRVFGPKGYAWYPQIWVESLGLWVDVSSVNYYYPEGFETASAAIHEAEKHTL